MDDNPNIIEQYGNSATRNDSAIVVGFSDDRTAYMSRLILDGSGDWTAWEPIGSAVDYHSNEHYATLNGCSFKLDNPTPEASPAAGTQG